MKGFDEVMMERNEPEPWAYLVPVFLLLILAAPMPPFFAVRQTPQYVLMPQMAAVCVLAIGFVFGWIFKRALLQFVSFLGGVLCVWQLPFFDLGSIEAQKWHVLSTEGAVAQASIINSDWRQPQAVFFLFRGGGGHPTHIFDLELRFSTTDRMVHVVRVSESYPPVWNANFTELLNTFRKGNVVPIRYLSNDPSLVRTQPYLDSFKPSALARPLFLIFAPWMFAAPVLVGLGRSRRRKASHRVR